MTCILLSPESFARCAKVEFIFRQNKKRRKIKLKKMLEIYASEGVGYVMVKNKYIGAFRLPKSLRKVLK